MPDLKQAAFRTTVSILVVLLITYIALLLIVNSGPFREWLRNEVAKRTGYEITSGELRLDPLLRLTLAPVKASKADKPVLEADRIELMLTPVDLLSKTIHRLRLVKPTLYLDAGDLLQSSKEPAVNITVRHLIVEDGALVLRLANGNSFTLKSLAMHAEDLSLTEATGLNLRADVPLLNGVASVAFSGNDSEKRATVRLEQPQSKASKSLAVTDRSSAALEAEITLSKETGGSLRLVSAGQATAFLIGKDRFSGHFDLHAGFEANGGTADIAARIVLTEVPSQPGFLPVAIPNGTTTLDLAGSFSVADKKLALRSLRLQSPLGDADGAGQVVFGPRVTISNSQITLRKIPLGPFKPLLPKPFDGMTVDGNLNANLEFLGTWDTLAILGTVQGSDIQLRGEHFSLASLSIKTPVAWTATSLRAADVQISGKKLLVRSTSQMPMSAEDLTAGGTLESRVHEPLKLAGHIHIRQGRFASLDGTRVGENLHAAGRFESTIARDRKQTAITGKLDITQGEILWGKFFGDLKPQRPAFDFDGDYTPASDILRLRRASLALATVGKVAARGDIEQASRNPLLRLELKSDDIQPAGIFEYFIRHTFNRSFPALDQLALGGRLVFAVAAIGNSDRLSLEGAVQLRGGELQNKVKNWSIGPVQLDLPLRVEYPGTSAPPPAANIPAGTLVVQSARFGSQTTPVMKTTLSLWNNALSFPQPVRLPVYGGTLEISGLAFKNVIENPQALSLGLEAKNLQMERLTEALGWYRFGGTLSGSIPRVEWDNGSLRSQGRIQVNVFGGTVQISQLEVEDPFSSVPSIKLDALFRNIDLEQASTTFAFGRISGILEGTVNGLVVTAGQASQFRANVHSVEKSGISQRISVESLNKITVLSSGNDAGAFYGGIAGFFDSFRYSKLGFRATLKNDKLALQGVESREDGEYLVVGSWLPPTVNVVSHTQTIAFSELLRRLQRIQESAPAEKPAG